MLNLKQELKTQQLFAEQVSLCTTLLRLYDINPQKFTEIISPRFQKSYPVDPFTDTACFWEYCDWLSSIFTGHWYGGKYPVLKTVNKKTVIDYVTAKAKGHSPFMKVVPFVEDTYITEYYAKNPLKTVAKVKKK